MKDRLISIISGSIAGYCIPFAIFSIAFEHIFLYIWIPIFSYIGVFIGAVLGALNILQLRKIGRSILLCTISVSLAISFSSLRGFFLKDKRESFAIQIANQIPDIVVDDLRYEEGNGIDIPPNVKMRISSNSAFEQVVDSYHKSLTSKEWRSTASGWFTGHTWEKDNLVIYIGNNTKDTGNSDYWLDIDFYGNWITHFTHSM